MDILTFTLIFIPVSLLFFITWRNRHALSRQLMEVQSRIDHLLNPGKRQAILNYVVCPHCREGKGIINPIYRVLEGVQHVAGTCNLCGRYICAPLR